jgi:hypothetical protein
MTTRLPLSARNIALTLVLLLLGSLVAVPSWASNTDGTRAFRASVSPDVCVTPGATTTFQLTITNTSNNITLGSANVTPGFVVDRVVSVSAGTARVSADGAVIELRDLGLPSLGSVVVSFAAAPPAGTYPFAIVAKQRNDFNGPPGNDLRLFGPTPTVTTGTCELAFLTEPGDALTGMPIPGTGTAVAPRVGIVTGTPPAPVSGLNGVAITVSLLPGAPGAVFTDSTVTVGTVGGVATFSNLRVDRPGSGYTLVASASGFTPVTSGQFEVADDLATCSLGELCGASLSVPGGSVQASGTATSPDGRLYLSVYTGEDCGDAPDGAGTIPTGVSVAGLDLTAKEITFFIDEETRKADTNNGVSSYQVCAEPVGSIAAGDTVGFLDRYTGARVVGADNLELPGDLIRGWLPDCSSGANAVGPPCIVSRTGTDDGGLRVTVSFGTKYNFK